MLIFMLLMYKVTILTLICVMWRDKIREQTMMLNNDKPGSWTIKPTTKQIRAWEWRLKQKWHKGYFVNSLNSETVGCINEGGSCEKAGYSKDFLHNGKLIQNQMFIKSIIFLKVLDCIASCYSRKNLWVEKVSEDQLWRSFTPRFDLSLILASFR